LLFYDAPPLVNRVIYLVQARPSLIIYLNPVIHQTQQQINNKQTNKNKKNNFLLEEDKVVIIHKPERDWPLYHR
jgi:hypothetical protein